MNKLLLTVCATGTMLVAGCSGGGASETDSVKLGDTDLGPVSSVSCSTDDGLTTITIDAAEKTVVKVTEEEEPTVKSVHIGEVGSSDHALVFIDAVSATGPEVTHQDRRYTISGTGLGASADANQPIDTTFEIDVTCPK